MVATSSQDPKRIIVWAIRSVWSASRGALLRILVKLLSNLIVAAGGIFLWLGLSCTLHELMLEVLEITYEALWCLGAGRNHHSGSYSKDQ